MDDKMGPEDQSKTMADVVNQVMDEDENQGSNSKALLNSPDSKEEKEENEETEGKKKEDLGCIDVGELRLMIQKSPSVIQCEQEELSKREAVLLIGIFISLTIACTVLIIIIGAFREKNQCLDQLANVTKILKKLRDEPQYCDSQSCMQISSAIIQSRGSVDPCRDFYSYTCASWSDMHPHVHSDWTAEDELRMRIKVRVVNALRRGGTDESGSVQRAKELFASCMDTETLDKQGYGALSDAIDSIGGWHLKSGWVQKSIEDQLATLHTNYWIHLLFSIRVVPDPLETGRYIVELGKGDLTLTATTDYNDKRKEKALLKFVTNSAVLLGIPQADAEKFAYNVFEFEKGIANVHEQGFSSGSKNERITITDLQVTSPEISWLKYLKTFGFDVTEQSHVLVSNKHYLKAISTILKAANRTTINNYVIWRQIYALSRDMDRSFRLAAVDFEMDLDDRPQPRWEHCYDDTVQWYKMAVGSLYSRHIAHQPELVQLVMGIRDELKNRIATNLTMPEGLKDRVLEKLEGVHIEYVASILEKGLDMLDTVYSFMHFFKTDSYQQKLLKLVKANSKRLTEIYADPQIITNEWPILSTDTKPYYCRHKNKLYIPAGSLDIPIYHDDLPTYYNFATMGTLIARQLLMAVDPNGLDDDVFTVPEWMDTTGEQYDNSFGCMAEYLSTKHQSRNFSTAAILADVTAMEVAFQAHITVGGRTQVPLAALGLSIDQTFFTSSLIAQCSMDMKKGARPTMTVLHQPEFAEAFHCPNTNDNMCSLFEA